jgi:hypothetical protein
MKSFICRNVLLALLCVTILCLILVTAEINVKAGDIPEALEDNTHSASVDVNKQEVELSLDGIPQGHVTKEEEEHYEDNLQHEVDYYEDGEDFDENDEEFVEDHDGHIHQHDDHKDYIENDYDDDDDDDEDDSQWDGRLESERIEAYNQRGYVWPIPDSSFIPNTTGYINTMRKRIEQVDKLTDVSDRWIGFGGIMSWGMIIPNYTEHGFGMTKCIDDELMDELRKTIREGYETAHLEGQENGSITGPLPPLKVDNDRLTTRVYKELQRYAEAWAGIPLIPYGAYGFRIYRNGAQLKMHTDIRATHIISFILHIDHSNDGTPWPLVIEDYHGNTHEVTLESGDLLFYESAKVLHGRPRPFNGTWYSSVFVHYYPAEGWMGKAVDIETDNAVPPGWEEPLFDKYVFDAPKLEFHGVTMTEPECEHMWCGLQNSTKWGGPAEAGYFLAPNMKKYPFVIDPYVPSVTNVGTEEELVQTT